MGTSIRLDPAVATLALRANDSQIVKAVQRGVVTVDPVAVAEGRAIVRDLAVTQYGMVDRAEVDAAKQEADDLSKLVDGQNEQIAELNGELAEKGQRITAQAQIIRNQRARYRRTVLRSIGVCVAALLIGLVIGAVVAGR